MLFFLLFVTPILCEPLQRLPSWHSSSAIRKFTIQAPGYSPKEPDDYVHVQLQAENGYIVGFEPNARVDHVHHMLLYGCETPNSEKNFWRGRKICGHGAVRVLYAWAKNTPKLDLPDGVAFKIGPNMGTINFLVLEIHYVKPLDSLDYSGFTLLLTNEPPKYLAAVMAFFSLDPIPPKMAQVQNNASCYYDGEADLHPFAFRVHTHLLGRVVSGYFKHDDKWTKIGKRNPLWPQIFETIEHPPTIRKGDLMASSCRYDSTTMNRTTPTGAMGKDEMCNFYMMFYWDATKEDPFPGGAYCGENNEPTVFDEYPREGFELLPKRLDLEEAALQIEVETILTPTPSTLILYLIFGIVTGCGLLWLLNRQLKRNQKSPFYRKVYEKLCQEDTKAFLDHNEHD